MNLLNNHDIREEFARLYQSNKFVIDKTGVKVVEIIGANFIASEDHIFGTPNQDYIVREIEWYNSMSRNVNDIPKPIPIIWTKCATPTGEINSNYGWCVYSEENGNQFENVATQLLKDSFSRRAEMIYTRPTMHQEYNRDGMSDFMCTEAVQYFIRDNKLHTIVKMRSSDAVFGFLNDHAWQVHIRDKLLLRLENIKAGNIIWSPGSLHIYERHFGLIQHYINTGEIMSQIPKK